MSHMVTRMYPYFVARIYTFAICKIKNIVIFLFKSNIPNCLNFLVATCLLCKLDLSSRQRKKNHFSPALPWPERHTKQAIFQIFPVMRFLHDSWARSLSGYSYESVPLVRQLKHLNVEAKYPKKGGRANAY